MTTHTSHTDQTSVDTPTTNAHSYNDDERYTLTDEMCSTACLNLMTIRDWVRFCVSSMRKADVALGQGTDDYFAEAAALVMQTLHLEWSINPEILDAVILPSERSDIVKLLTERINNRTPVAYLLNLAYFAGQPYYVDERVLIPRSPIAELIAVKFFPYFADDDANTDISITTGNANTSEGSDLFDFGLPNQYSHPSPHRILDMCTGSGCIAIALAYAFEQASVDASDLSRDALAVAAVNVDHHNMYDQVNLIESNLFEKIPTSAQTGGYDLIVSNPPYVNSNDMADLPDEFNHEPELALAAGQDGLDLVRIILAQAANYLSEHGLLVVEVGRSAWALMQEFPEVDFYWLQFKQGGDGVFALTAQQCRLHQALFVQRINA